jgi:biotin-(acetyl-CoA carboxylase) ligase
LAREEMTIDKVEELFEDAMKEVSKKYRNLLKMLWTTHGKVLKSQHENQIFEIREEVERERQGWLERVRVLEKEKEEIDRQIGDIGRRKINFRKVLLAQLEEVL